MDDNLIETVEYGKGKDNSYPNPLEEVTDDGN